MKHFDEEAWADFVRNLVAEDVKASMQQHINNGCEACEGTLKVWQRVLTIAKEEQANTPPEDVVRVVKSHFAALTSSAQESRPLRLVFDSFLQPAAVGVRGSLSARQLLYETDELYIDLRLERQSEANRVSLVGQVLDRGTESRASQGLPINLVRGKLPLTSTATNQFGEFHLEFEPQDQLGLCIEMDGQNAIRIPLVNFRPGEIES